MGALLGFSTRLISRPISEHFRAAEIALEAGELIVRYEHAAFLRQYNGTAARQIERQRAIAASFPAFQYL
ncbi:hypothetical protein [Sphingobium sp. TomMM35A]